MSEESSEEPERRSSGFSVSLFRIVGFLIIYTTGLVGIVSWLLTSSFTNALDSRLDRIALQNYEVFAKKADAINRAEFELKIELVRQETRRVEDRLNEERNERKSFDELLGSPRPRPATK